MPYYDFRCQDCGDFQIHLTFDDIDNKVKPECPNCKTASTINRIYGAPHIKKYHGSMVPTQISGKKVN